MKSQSKFSLYLSVFVFILSAGLLPSWAGTATAATAAAAAADTNDADDTTQLPDCLLNYRFGPKQHIAIVEKSTQSLFIYSNYQSQPLEKFTVTTGREPGQKYAEGDMKTPEGIYFFRRVLTGDELPKEDDYGEKAFTMNYPNPIDIRDSKNGSGIWLHGAFDENKTGSPNNSRGCVVMKNEDLMRVSKYIFLNETPIIIYNRIDYSTPQQLAERRDRFISILTDWKQNWENKDIDGYISFYENDFYDDGRSLEAFKEYKKNLNDRYRFIKIFLSKISIYAFNNYHVAIFDQLYVSDINHFSSKKIQYWRNHSDKCRIVDEINIRIPPVSKFELTTGNYISIEKFRKDYLMELKETTFRFIPETIHLEKISLAGDSVTLYLERSRRGEELKLIPVLLSKNEGDTAYTSLPGIRLANGVPQNYEQGFLLRGSAQSGQIVLDTDKEAKLKSLTLFVVDHENQVQQIITYFIKQSPGM